MAQVTISTPNTRSLEEALAAACPIPPVPTLSIKVSLSSTICPTGSLIGSVQHPSQTTSKPTSVDVSLAALTAEFEKLTGAQYIAPKERSSIQVEGLPHGLCIGVEAHREVRAAPAGSRLNGC